MIVDQDSRIELFNNMRLDLWEPDSSPYQEVTHYYPSKSVTNLEPKRVFNRPTQRRLDPLQGESKTNFSRNSIPETPFTIAGLRKDDNLASSKLPFLLKLHEMLGDVEKTGNQHIVSWLPDGRAFKVYRPKYFVQKIIPYYFNQSKYKSFQRQLHLYEFTRTRRGPEAGAYSHPNFVRGVTSLCSSMNPVKIKGRFKKQQINLESLRDQEHQYPTTITDLLYPSKTIVAPPSPTLASKTFHDDDPSEFMKKIEGLLVTGAALAKQLEETSRTKEVVVPPHDGDVVYIFGGMPFHYMDHHSSM
jgi:hypothetical protein